jgi:hypothetical protein
MARPVLIFVLGQLGAILFFLYHKFKKGPNNSRSISALHLPMKNNPFGRVYEYYRQN